MADSRCRTLKAAARLEAVMVLMRTAPNCEAFGRALQRAYPKMNENVQLALGDDE